VAAAIAALAAAPGDAAQRLAATQAQLRCGTQCGSCLPTLRRLAAAAAPAPAAIDGTIAS